MAKSQNVNNRSNIATNSIKIFKMVHIKEIKKKKDSMTIREKAEPCFLSLYSTPTSNTKRGLHTVTFFNSSYYPDPYFH